MMHVVLAWKQKLGAPNPCFCLPGPLMTFSCRYYAKTILKSFVIVNAGYKIILFTFSSLN